MLASIRAGDAAWETMVPPAVAEIIKERKLFNYGAAKAEPPLPAAPLERAV